MTEFMTEQNPEKHHNIDDGQRDDLGIHYCLKVQGNLGTLDKSFSVQITHALVYPYYEGREYGDYEQQDVDPDVFCK